MSPSRRSRSVFLGAIVWFASRLYRQHRTTLYSLGDRRRAILYVALGVGHADADRQLAAVGYRGGARSHGCCCSPARSSPCSRCSGRVARVLRGPHRPAAHRDHRHPERRALRRDRSSGSGAAAATLSSKCVDQSPPTAAASCPTSRASTCSATQRGKVIYVGKANSIRKRVASHFSNPSTRGGPRSAGR